jgi:hypothetical protein
MLTRSRHFQRAPSLATATARPYHQSLNTASQDLEILLKIRKKRYKYRLTQYNRIDKIRFGPNDPMEFAEFNISKYITLQRTLHHQWQRLVEDSNDYGRALSKQQVLTKLREATGQRN